MGWGCIPEASSIQTKKHVGLKQLEQHVGLKHVGLKNMLVEKSKESTVGGSVL